jgi:hypothetical protein
MMLGFRGAVVPGVSLLAHFVRHFGLLLYVIMMVFRMR